MRSKGWVEPSTPQAGPESIAIRDSSWRRPALDAGAARRTALHAGADGFAGRLRALKVPPTPSTAIDKRESVTFAGALLQQTGNHDATRTCPERRRTHRPCKTALNETRGMSCRGMTNERHPVCEHNSAREPARLRHQHVRRRVLELQHRCRRTRLRFRGYAHAASSSWVRSPSSGRSTPTVRRRFIQDLARYGLHLCKRDPVSCAGASNNFSQSRGTPRTHRGAALCRRSWPASSRNLRQSCSSHEPTRHPSRRAPLCPRAPRQRQPEPRQPRPPRAV